MGKVRPKKSRKMPTKQGKGRSPINGARPPVERQFGQPNGNPRSNGSWKKEDTLRYKLERLINGISEEELKALLDDPKTKPGLKRLAILLYKSNYERPDIEWRVWEGALNQAYGMPKQAIEQTNLEPPVPLSPRGKGLAIELDERGVREASPLLAINEVQTVERGERGRGAKRATSEQGAKRLSSRRRERPTTPSEPRSTAKQAEGAGTG